MRLGRTAAIAALFSFIGAVASEPADQTPWDLRALVRRAECKAYEVKQGDDCDTIARKKCGLKNVDALYKLNKDAKDMCKKGIVPGDHFCCNEGTMPNFDPDSNKDGTCKHILVDDGDDCDKLAEACGVTTKQFYEYNGDGKSDFCKKLLKKQILCCTPGKKPDLRPKKNEDGSCKYVEIKDKLCDDLQDEYFLKDDDLDKFNVGKTWGWQGCKRLMPGQRVCVSYGDPPLPAEDKKAVCGPTVSGTKAKNGTKVADLNPCPLNACCNIWGQCGTTSEACASISRVVPFCRTTC